ncbi:paraquat-inducible protein A [Tateyamaria sp. ANG-S1]|uniref:paraquat-inducible protein A n=1 Tax=Tateyamaria sp. ANG-S1 TaxID=1577905 RepID=UPI00057C66B9|nr:paraquat-inducible protein A [Tateyamaria sp. ANG-S1]KIC48246.1 paraquat-inducible protein A [Tateyamaria sp. ANG-S1]
MTVTAREKGLVACRECARVWPADHTHCSVCGNTIRSRDTQSLQKVWAWWIAGVLAYIPANLYPMLKTRTLFQTSEDTIIAGALELASHGSWSVAIIILIASVAIPLGKFFAIAYLALAVRSGATWPPGRQYILYEVVEYIGRWSMIDVFVVAILCSLVQLNVAASITPGIAALTFALSVIFTMLSAQSLDPRLIWDRIETKDTKDPV